MENSVCSNGRRAMASGGQWRRGEIAARGGLLRSGMSCAPKMTPVVRIDFRQRKDRKLYEEEAVQ